MVNCPKQELFVFFVCFLFLDISETSFYHKHIHITNDVLQNYMDLQDDNLYFKRKEKKKKHKKETNIAVSKRNTVTY